MSRKVVIERYAPELPPVCVATGATGGVEYYLVKMQYSPWWARFFFGAIGAWLTMKKAEVMVPFTPDAHARYKRAQWMPAVIILGGMALSFLLMLTGSSVLAMVAALGFMGSIVGGLGYAMAVTKKAGPRCTHIDDTSITMEIPNTVAADAIERGVAPTSGGIPAGVAPTVF